MSAFIQSVLPYIEAANWVQCHVQLYITRFGDPEAAWNVYKVGSLMFSCNEEPDNRCCGLYKSLSQGLPCSEAEL